MLQKMWNATVSAVTLAIAFLLSLVAAPFAAATGPDFSGILDGLDTGTIVTAIVAACAIIALVGFAKWGGKKLARFFG
jgi:hypothetical protein